MKRNPRMPRMMLTMSQPIWSLMADHTTSQMLMAVRMPRTTIIQTRRASTALSEVARLKDERLKDHKLRIPGQLRSFHDVSRGGRSCGNVEGAGCGPMAVNLLLLLALLFAPKAQGCSYGGRAQDAMRICMLLAAALGSHGQIPDGTPQMTDLNV